MNRVLSSPYDAVLYGDMLIRNCSSAFALSLLIYVFIYEGFCLIGICRCHALI
jgi:hypothetical protein